MLPAPSATASPRAAGTGTYRRSGPATRPMPRLSRAGARSDRPRRRPASGLGGLGALQLAVEERACLLPVPAHGPRRDPQGLGRLLVRHAAEEAAFHHLDQPLVERLQPG